MVLQAPSKTRRLAFASRGYGDACIMLVSLVMCSKGFSAASDRWSFSPSLLHWAAAEGGLSEEPAADLSEKARHPQRVKTAWNQKSQMLFAWSLLWFVMSVYW